MTTARIRRGSALERAVERRPAAECTRDEGVWVRARGWWRAGTVLDAYKARVHTWCMVEYQQASGKIRRERFQVDRHYAPKPRLREDWRTGDIER